MQVEVQVLIAASTGDDAFKSATELSTGKREIQDNDFARRHYRTLNAAGKKRGYCVLKYQ